MTVNPISFKGVYKVSLPKVPEAQNEQEKAAFTDTAVNVGVMGANSSVDRPKVDADKKFMYFKIDDKYKLNEFKDNLVKHFNLQEVSSNIWELERDKFISKFNNKNLVP